ncbi:MAG TPA: C40 family peptidase [Frankiaceae bacterium]|nr:C40 family peptidase [Frankiaceae bacterium]
MTTYVTPPVATRTRHRLRWLTPLILLGVLAFFASACSPPGPSSVGMSAAIQAARQTGKPYVYGAAGPNSFDCSGLVQYSYRLAGRSLPRTAQQQHDVARPISAASARPGDLVFFGPSRGIYHDGIYVGFGAMRDAPHTGAVVRVEPVWTNSGPVSFGRIY